MKRHILNSVLVLALATLPMAANAGWSAAQQATHQAFPAPSQVEELPTPDVGFNSSPLMFIKNIGQWDDGARFQVWGGPAGTMWLAEDAIWITVLEPGREDTSRQVDWEPSRRDKDSNLPLGWPSEDRVDPAPRRGISIKLSFIDANPHPSLEAFGRLDTTISYFYGNDPDQWRPDVPVWGGVRYGGLYPGIDLELTGENERLALRLVARADADLSVVRLSVEGADEVVVGRSHLRLSTAAGEIAFPLLQAVGRHGEAAVQSRGAQLFEVAMPFFAPSFVSKSWLATSNSPDDDPTALHYGTYLGRSEGYNYLRQDIAVDAAGSTLVTGDTYFIDFPTTPGAFDPEINGRADAFVTKLNPAGDALIYSTFIGGSEDEVGRSIVVDDAGCAYITGSTKSADFPVTPGAFDTTYHGGGSLYGDAYVVKLNQEGRALAYATFLGGNSADNGNAVTVDGTGSAFVTGETDSSDFPTTPDAFDTSYNGSHSDRGDAFVAKLNPEGNALGYATFLGGSAGDWGNAIALDGTDDLYVTGATMSVDFPVTAGAFNTIYGGGRCVPYGNSPCTDAFVAKLDHSGSTVIQATFLGGHKNDWGTAVAVDGSGSIYVVGSTGSSNFPATPGAFDTTFGEGGCGPGHDEYPCPDAFVARFDPTVSTLIYATFLGGGTYDYGEDGVLASDGSGSVYVTGYTWSDDFPTTPNAFDTANNGNDDAFLAELDPTGAVLTYATFVGGSQEDWGRAIALDGSGIVHMTGRTVSTDFPTTPGAFDTSFNGYYSVFIVELMLLKNLYLPIVLAD